MRRTNAGITSVPDSTDELYTRNGKDVWRVQAYFSGPSVTIRNVETGETLTGGVGCLNFADFKRLVPADNPDA